MNRLSKEPSTEFTHTIEIDTSAEAPKHIIESQQYASSYYAVARRPGGIKSTDFLGLSQRFVALATEAYGHSRAELSLNRGVPVGPDVTAASLGWYEGPAGTSIDMDRFDTDSFQELFEEADTLVLTVRPREATEPFKSSFAQVEWTRARAGKLFFYAQDGGSYETPASERPLQGLLTRKMFYVPHSAPKGMLRVKLGIEAFLNASEGRLDRPDILGALALGRAKSR